MKVKKYVAQSMPEAMSKIRKELGKDAVILSSKEIQEGGFLGFFKKRKIEVVAALDKSPLPQKQSSVGLQKEEKGHRKQKGVMDTDVVHELKHMRRILEMQAEQNNTKFKLDYQVIYTHLIHQEVEEKIATEVVEQVERDHKANSESKNLKGIAEDVKAEIEKRLGNLSFEGITANTQIVHFIGPTGVGKTTTIAKIAAKSMLKEKKRVALITMDTYRIAAIEQLKTYAKILDTPIEVVYSVQDYQHAIQKFQNYDLILVDTAGRNYREEEYVKELTKNIHKDERVMNYLVLSLTAKPNDMRDIYNSFRHLKINGFIFTKIDETRQYGSLLNLPLMENIDIAYITNGQEVPDNIFKPTKEVISNYIVGDLIDS